MKWVVLRLVRIRREVTDRSSQYAADMTRRKSVNGTYTQCPIFDQPKGKGGTYLIACATCLTGGAM